jgi:flagellar biosynthesis chaperone FliJ
MGFVSDAGTALKNVLLMQANFDRLERVIERQNHDIADLREVVARVSERLVRVETKFEMLEMKPARTARTRAITQEKK